MDADGRFFGFVSAGISLLPEGYTGDLLKLQKAQIDAMAARNPAIKARFGTVAPTPVAFTHVTLFDSVGGKFLRDQTVVADAGANAIFSIAADRTITTLAAFPARMEVDYVRVWQMR